MLILPFRRIIPSAGPSIIPGSVSYTTPGSYTFVVPYYRNLTVDVRGAGGGGAGSRVADSYQYSSSSGGASVFYGPDGNVIGYGGGYATGSVGSFQNGSNGGHGAGSGGDINPTGGGGVGGLGSITSNQGIWTVYGGNGGYGGRAVKSWNKLNGDWYTRLKPKTAVTVLVGTHGVKSECEPTWVVRFNTDGADGAVYISWS